MSEMLLTDKQKEAIELIKKGENVFITGPAGTGKSFIINYIRELYGNSNYIGITSTTGVSALAIGGRTLHSFLGIGLGTEDVDTLVEKIEKFKKTLKKWTDTSILIIDEISMLNPDLLDKLEEVANRIRNTRKLNIKNTPFGGIQIIATGDFLQLPVVKCDNFCFEAKCWDKLFPRVVYLTEIIRQSDKKFQKVLNTIRLGIVNEKVKKLLDSRKGIKLENEFGILPTQIYTTNNDVEVINQRELDKLYEKTNCLFYEYDADIQFYYYVKDLQKEEEKYFKDCIALKTLQLCEGAQVMLLKNLDVENGLANGSRGVILRFEGDYPIVKFLNGEEKLIVKEKWEFKEGKESLCEIKQMPLRIAYACTVHKSQSITLDYAIVNLSNTFAFGQAYVALSRVKNMEGLSIINIDYSRIQANPKAISYYKKLEKE